MSDLVIRMGLKAPVKDIDVMGQPTTIREYLRNFLSRLRSHRRNDYLWRGNICIDQGEDCERNHQLQLTNQIYHKAHQVLVWRGEAYRGSSINLLTINLINGV